MSSLVPFAVAGLAVGQLAGGLPTVSGEETGIHSDQLLIDQRSGMWLAKGHAILNTGDVLLRADEISFDPQQQRATARGNVMLVQGLLVAVAEEVDVNLATAEASVVNGLVIQKRGISPERLWTAKSPDELQRLGQNTMSATGRRIRRLGPDHFAVDGIAFTPCDCDPAKPSWRIRSLHADVISGDRATLTLPVIYVHDVPVLAFPWLYLPMTDRRTGLLMPRIGTTRNGFSLEQPVFVTMGRSYDLTLTPAYYFGGDDPIGVQGPRIQTEFEYAPSPQTPYGRATLDLLYDYHPRLNPQTGRPFPKLDPATGQKVLDANGNEVPDPTHRGLRGSGSLRHAQDLGGGFYDRVDASFVSDGFYIQSLSADLFAREAQYTASTATVYRRTQDSYAGMDVAVRQDLRFTYGFFDNARSPESFPEHGPNTPARLPELIIDIPESRLARLLYGSFRLEYARATPLFGRLSIDPISVAQPDGTTLVDPAPRQARDRVDFRPRISLPLEAGRFARFTPYALYRQDLYFGELSGEAFHRGYPLAGALLETEVSKVFPTKNGNWRHSLTPSFEIRYVPHVFKSGPAKAYDELNGYDEIDRSVPSDGFLQGVAEVSQKLIQSEAGRVNRYLRLGVGQGFDLRAGSRADAFARLIAVSDPFSAGAIFRYDVQVKKIAQFSANAGFDNHKGSAVYVQYDNLVVAGPDNLRRGIDELVGPPINLLSSTNPHALDRAQTLTAHAGVRFKFGLGLAYDVIVAPENDPRCAPPQPDASCIDRPTPTPWTIRQQVVTLSLNPSCDCWRLDLRALSRREFILPEFRANQATPAFPDFSVTLTIARFGSFGLQ